MAEERREGGREGKATRRKNGGWKAVRGLELPTDRRRISAGNPHYRHRQGRKGIVTISVWSGDRKCRRKKCEREPEPGQLSYTGLWCYVQKTTVTYIRYVCEDTSNLQKWKV
jgi:hypothetical protein